MIRPVPWPALALIPALLEVVEGAANILAWHGHIEYDDVVPADVAAGLLDLAVRGRCGPITCPAPVGADALASHWLAQRQRVWELSLPVWPHPCGAIYKTLLDGSGRELFYELTAELLLGELVGVVRRNGAGVIKQSDMCPFCGDPFVGRPTPKTAPKLPPQPAQQRYQQAAMF